MITVLSTRRLLFDDGPDQLVRLAMKYGFDAVDATPAYFEAPESREPFVAAVREAGLSWGLAGMPVPLGTGTSDADFDALVARLQVLCPVLAEAGVASMSAWLAPGNDDADFEETMHLHVTRLNRIASTLAHSDLRLALEYVGPLTWRIDKRYPFICDLAGLLNLIGRLGDPERCGLLLDTFHWYTAGDSADDIRRLDKDDVIAVDLNDAPAGVPRERQLDLERAQPGATGVIDIPGFLAALRSIGFDGLVQAEPFSAGLRWQPKEARVSEARAALTSLLDA